MIVEEVSVKLFHTYILAKILEYRKYSDIKFATPFLLLWLILLIYLEETNFFCPILFCTWIFDILKWFTQAIPKTPILTHFTSLCSFSPMKQLSSSHPTSTCNFLHPQTWISPICNGNNVVYSMRGGTSGAIGGGSSPNPNLTTTPLTCFQWPEMVVEITAHVQDHPLYLRRAFEGQSAEGGTCTVRIYPPSRLVTYSSSFVDFDNASGIQWWKFLINAAGKLS